MSSLQSPTPLSAADSRAALLAAVGDVAGRCFFASVEQCDPDRFADLVVGTGRWFSAAVDFEEAAGAGSLRCLVPEDLAATMLETCSGRTREGAAPATADVADLMGELADMVCGAWLTRDATGRTFTRRKQPVAVSLACAPATGESWTTFTVNGRPLALAIRVGVPADVSALQEA